MNGIAYTRLRRWWLPIIPHLKTRSAAVESSSVEPRQLLCLLRFCRAYLLLETMPFHLAALRGCNNGLPHFTMLNRLAFFRVPTLHSPVLHPLCRTLCRI